MVALAVALAIAGWAPMPAHGLVAVYRGTRGETLAVTRAQVPNPDAWRATTRDAYLDELERGALAKLAGGTRLAHHHVEVHGVPALDLELRARGGATIVVRYLVFRTYTLAAAIEVPAGGDPAAARAIVASFTPDA